MLLGFATVQSIRPTLTCQVQHDKGVRYGTVYCIVQHNKEQKDDATTIIVFFLLGSTTVASNGVSYMIVIPSLPLQQIRTYKYR